MKAKFLAILALAMFLMLPTLAQAQVRAGSVHVSPMAGAIFLDNDYGLDDGFLMSMGLGYNFDENWALEFAGSYAPSLDFNDEWDRGGNADITMARLNALYHFNTDSAFVPYVTLGGGGLWASADDSESYNSGAINGGLGFKYFFNETVALRMEVLDVYTFKKFDNGSGTNNIVATAGLTFQFGPRTDCVDSDMDGVCDDYDKCPGTPAGYKVDADGCPITVTIRMDVKFDFDKAVVKQEYMPEVAKVADFMKAHPQTRTTVEGHTDDRGKPEYNQKLSQRRADAVRQTLVSVFGIESSRLTSVGHGEMQPIADNSTEAGRYQNRRVVGVVEGAEMD